MTKVRASDAAQAVRIGVIGAGYVGLVSGICLAAIGHRVTIRDIDSSRVAMLGDGIIPIHEPGLAELLVEARARITFTLSMRRLVDNSDIIFVAVDTPRSASGDADLSRVRQVLAEIAEVRPDHVLVLVMKSTVPVGTGDRIRAELVSLGLDQISYCSNPEFLREGTAIADFMAPDRIVVGDFERVAGDRVAALFAPFLAPTLRTSVASAEMIKYASNAFLATKISFINEIANVCEQVGADVSVVAQGMGSDPRIGPSFLHAGIGYGGSCFPKDVAALKQLAGNTGYHFQLLTAVVEVNELQKRRVVGKLKKHLGSLDGARIALLGLAFKPDTDDLREASSVVLAHRLLSEGAMVRAFDPVVRADRDGQLRGVEVCLTVDDALRDADAAVLVTEWPELVGLDWRAAASLMRRPLIVDGRNALDAPTLTEAGFTVDAIGRPLAPPVWAGEGIA
jgi:UDPglucose 6-dehydrogenase